MSALSRRAFLKSAGALVLGVHLPARGQAGPGEINAWVVVLPNELVIIRYARSEMGQGSMTAAAQLVAEELECDWKRVRVDYADSNEQLRRKRVWGPMSSAGSRTIRESQEVLRNAGAAAREMLIAAAAQSWGVAVKAVFIRLDYGSELIAGNLKVFPTHHDQFLPGVIFCLIDLC